MKLGLSLDGVEQFNDMLTELGEEVGSRAIRDGAMRGGALVAAVAQTLAPVASGQLAAGIHAEEVTSDSTRFADIGSGVGFVGVVVGPDWKQWYGHFTEGGTAPHELDSTRRHTSGFHPGIRARRFMQTALDENADQVVGFIGEEIRGAVEHARAR